jgi:hypothetical protein
MAPMRSSRGPAAKTLLVLGILLAVGAVLRGLDLADPWSSRGFKSAFAWACCSPARNLAEDGLLSTGGMPYFYRLRLADGSFETAWYANHPALTIDLTAASLVLFGKHEWAARLPWFLASLWSLVAGWRLLRLVYGERVALLGTWFLAVVPLAADHGSLAWCDYALLGLTAVMFRRYWLWLGDGRRAHLLAGAGCALAGGLLDWPMHFSVAALGVHALILGVSRWRRWRALLPLLSLPAASVLAVGIHGLQMLAVMGWGRSVGDAGRTTSWLMTGYLGPLAFARIQLEHLTSDLTPPLAVLLVLALAQLCLRALRRAPRAGDGLALALCLPGLFYVLAFPVRSFNHDFFWELGLLGFASLAGVELAHWHGRLAARRPRLAAGGGLALLLLASLWCARAVVGKWRAERDDLPRALAGHPAVAPAAGDPEAVLLVAPGEGLLLSWYSAAPVVGPFTNAESLEQGRAHLDERLEPGRAVYFLMTASVFAELRPTYEALKASGVASQRGVVEAAGRPPLTFEIFRLR